MQQTVAGQNQENWSACRCKQSNRPTHQQAKQKTRLDHAVDLQIDQIDGGNQVGNNTLGDPRQIGNDTAEGQPLNVRIRRQQLPGKGLGAYMCEGVGHDTRAG